MLPAAALHAVVAARLSGPVAGAAEADVAAAVFGAGESDLPVVPVRPVDVAGVTQFQIVRPVLARLVPDVPVVDGVRVVALVAGLVVVAMVWVAARRLGASAPAAAVATLAVGAFPPAAWLHGLAGAAGVASAWSALAAVAVLRDRPRTRLAAVLMLPAVLTAPLAAVPPLAMAAWALATGDRGTGRLARVPVRRVAAGLAAVAALAIALTASGDGPLAVTGGARVGPAVTVSLVLVAALIGVAVAIRLPWLRSAVVPLAATTACLVVPGAGRIAAVSLLVPILAVSGALLLDTLPLGRFAPAPGARWFAPAAGSVGLLLAVVTVLVPWPRSPELDVRALAEWVRTDLDPSLSLWADPLDRAVLVQAGVPAARLRAAGAADGPRLCTDRPGGDPAGCTGAVLFELGRGSGPGPSRVYGPSTVADPAARTRFGAELVANPRLTLDPTTAMALREGRVDVRVMALLAGLAQGDRVEVAAVPPVPGEPESVARHVVELRLGGLGLDPADHPLVTWIENQQGPFRPSSVRAVPGGLLVGFPVPEPPRLLTG